MAESKRYKVKLNSTDKIEDLLQESYDLTCQQYKTVQDEINKIANTTVIKDLDIEGKEKYGKIINNYLALQQKAITQKFDIAKLMAEVVKFSGDMKRALDETKKSATTLDIDKLRKLAVEATSNDVEEYQLKKQ